MLPATAIPANSLVILILLILLKKVKWHEPVNEKTNDLTNERNFDRTAFSSLLSLSVAETSNATVER
jgi:hypothetical protein